MNKKNSKFNLNEIQNLKWEAPQSAMDKWNPAVHAAANNNDETTINIYEGIGESWDGTGFTLKTLSAILRNAKGKDIVVNINSPGGDFFVGVAAMNLLKEYEGNVRVRIVGIAASAASVIAMGGDTIEIAESGFLMIHNAWTIAIGNKSDMQYTADILDKFDTAMAEVYADRSDEDMKAVKKMMDAETFLSGKEAVEKGFADSLLAEEDLQLDKSEQASYTSAVAKVNLALAKQGVPRSERRELLKELKNTHNAVDSITHNADTNITHNADEEEQELKQALTGLLETLKN